VRAVKTAPGFAGFRALRAPLPRNALRAPFQSLAQKKAGLSRHQN